MKSDLSNRGRESKLEEISIREVEIAELELNLADVEISHLAFNFKPEKQIFHDKLGSLFNTKLFEEIDRTAREFISKTYANKTGCTFKIDPDYQRPIFLKMSGANESTILYDICCGYKIILEKEKPDLKGQVPFGD
jgi:hypothetical protein